MFLFSLKIICLLLGGEESFTINVQFFFSEKPRVYLLKRYNGCTTRIETE